MAGKKKKSLITEHVPARPQKRAEVKSAPTFPKLAIVGVLLLTALLYGGVLQLGLTFIDDDMYLLKNPYIRNFSFDGVRAIFTSFYEFNYHPLTTLTYLVEYKLFEFNPLPYHLFNLLLHLINTWLVFTLAWRFSGKASVGFIVSLLFAIHPMHVETVAWVSERKGLLCALFYLLSLVMYVRFVDTGLKKKFYIFSLLFFIASLLSKSAAVTLPLLLIAVDVYRGRKITARLIVEKIPFLLLSILFGILAIMSQSAGGALNDITTGYGFVNRVFLFTSGLAFYFIKLVVPVHLSAIHYFPNISAGGALQWWYYASLPFLLIVAWLLARRHEHRRETLFGIAFFLVAISVMLQVITVGSAIAAERYTYVSYIGLFYIAAQGLVNAGPRMKAITTVVFSIVAILFCFQTWNRVPVWRDTDTIFTDIVEKNKDNKHNYLVYYHWGGYKQWLNMQAEAIPDYTKAIEIEPGFQAAYIKRGEAYEWTKNLPNAMKDYREAIRINRKSAMVYNNIGWAYFESKDTRSALLHLDTAIMLDNKLATAYNNRGWILLQSGDSTAAIRDFDKAIASSPGFAKAYYNRAYAMLNSGKIFRAIDDYSMLIKLNPNDDKAYLYRGECYKELKNKTFAADDLRRAALLGNSKAWEELNLLEQ